MTICVKRFRRVGVGCGEFDGSVPILCVVGVWYFHCEIKEELVGVWMCSYECVCVLHGVCCCVCTVFFLIF
jgi:hypothetical protein